MDPTLRPPVDVRMALAFPMRDPGWPGKLTLGAAFCVLALLLIGIPIVAGYLRRLFVRAVEDVDAPLPEWEVAQDLEDGLPVLAVLAVYGLAGFVLVQIPVLGLLLALVPAVLLPAAVTRVCAHGRLSEGFDVPAMLEYVRDNLSNYLLAALLTIAVGALSVLGLLLLVVGVFVTSFWAAVIGTHAFAQVYRNSKLVTPHPIAVHPEPPVVVGRPATPVSP